MAGSLPARAQDWTVAPPPDGEVQQNFDDALTPYGDWVDVNGTKVWRPAASVVGEDFQPYATAGQWVYSDYGWYFQSDYPWGWAPFHYGRWALDVNFGWVWIPGSVWAPAWVDWRVGGGYIGWAPLPPIGWSVVVQPWRPYWCFVPGAYFPGHDFWAYRLPVERIHYAYAATAPLHQAVAFGGARWYAGPPLSQVERASSQPVPRVAGPLTPPAPGRVQPIHLQPPRGYAGAGTPRPGAPGVRPPGAVHPGAPASTPMQPATRPAVSPPGSGSARPAPAPTPAPARPSPRQGYFQQRPTPGYGGPRASPSSPVGERPASQSWSGTMARSSTPTSSFAGGRSSPTPRSFPGGGVTSSRGHSSGHAVRR